MCMRDLINLHTLFIILVQQKHLIFRKGIVKKVITQTKFKTN
jgi:hypothetical protein